MQVGGALGTAVLGAAVSAKVASALPGHLGPAASAIPPAQLDALKELAAVGMAPPGLSGPGAELIAQAAHRSFMDGLHFGFTMSMGLALVSAFLALFVKAGRKPEGTPAAIG